MSSNDKDAASGVLMPRGRLTIGVTGHRLNRLGLANVAPVTAAIDDLLARIGQAAGSADHRDLRLVTSLAEGADSIAADRAVARGWTLDIVLPFFRDTYATDFAPGEPRARYERQLAAAAAVMELPGDRGDEDGIAYERAGRLVLAQSDILVAVWDGDPARGRGGAAQIVAEAVAAGIPVVHLDPAVSTPTLLWAGLDSHELGRTTVGTVARGGLDALPALIRDLMVSPSDPGNRAMLARFNQPVRRRLKLAFAYPLLLAIIGVRPFRRSDIWQRERVDPVLPSLCSTEGGFAARVQRLLAPRFAHADAAATRIAQTFRSVYVANFTLAALAVVFSLLGLALPTSAKPILLATELAAISIILLQTRAGRRDGWHRQWLDNRALAERLRCLAVSAQLGNLDLRATASRAPDWVAWYCRATARETGLPSARVDQGYLAWVRGDLTTLIRDQVGYLAADAQRMHRLDHRLHRLGTILFILTAATCFGLLLFKVAMAAMPALEPLSHPLGTAVTIVGAALPAIGAAIYGIRTQGDFAGIASRSFTLADKLSHLARLIAQDKLEFDLLDHRVCQTTGLLTADLTNWLQTYDARPLTLPG